MNKRFKVGDYFIDTYTVGSFGVNNYLIFNPRNQHAILIDAGDDVSEIINYINKKSLRLSHIINTHGHLDHIFGNQELKQNFGSKICIHKEEKEALTDPKVNLSIFMGLEVVSPPADILLEETSNFSIEDITFQILHCPGHSRGGIALLWDGHLFCGDILFKGSIGRTDFPGGDINVLLENIKNKILPLDDDIVVLPGHGPATTIGQEKRNNPFLQDIQ